MVGQSIGEVTSNSDEIIMRLSYHPFTLIYKLVSSTQLLELKTIEFFKIVYFESQWINYLSHI